MPIEERDRLDVQAEELFRKRQSLFRSAITTGNSPSLRDEYHKIREREAEVVYQQLLLENRTARDRNPPISGGKRTIPKTRLQIWTSFLMIIVLLFILLVIGWERKFGGKMRGETTNEAPEEETAP